MPNHSVFAVLAVAGLTITLNGSPDTVAVTPQSPIADVSCMARSARLTDMEAHLQDLVSDTSQFRQEQRDSLGVAFSIAAAVSLVEVDSICQAARNAVRMRTADVTPSLESVAVFRLGAARYFVWDPRPTPSGHERGFVFDSTFALVSQLKL